MKKVKNKSYQDITAEKKFIHNLKRKSKEYNHDKNISLPNTNFLELSTNYSKPAKRHKLHMPNICSIIDNRDETIVFFNDVLYYVNERIPVFIDSKHVQKITPDAMLYFILILEEIHNKHNNYSLRGNMPKDKYCKKMLQESGFLSYVSSHKNKYKKDTDIFTIREGEQTESQIAKEVLQYVKKHLNIEQSNKNTRAIYALIIEAMANTHNHAVVSHKDKKKWYLMAYYTEDGNVEFAFLDSGAGIPKTIRQNFNEKIKFLFQSEGAADHTLIASALNGDFRTQTGQRKRGKGLPKMNELAQEGYIKDLVIISNKGYVNPTNDIKHNLNEKFHGTLISWKATKRIGE
jgi:anti-sigma regulatory factor (Ser/Thr protein kinase)